MNRLEISSVASPLQTAKAKSRTRAAIHLSRVIQDSLGNCLTFGHYGSVLSWEIPSRITFEGAATMVEESNPRAADIYNTLADIREEAVKAGVSVIGLDIARLLDRLQPRQPAIARLDLLQCLTTVGGLGDKTNLELWYLAFAVLPFSRHAVQTEYRSDPRSSFHDYAKRHEYGPLICRYMEQVAGDASDGSYVFLKVDDLTGGFRQVHGAHVGGELPSESRIRGAIATLLSNDRHEQETHLSLQYALCRTRE